VMAEGEARHARINLDAAARCPFFSQDSLCTIHRDYGESYLSETCTNYPRISRRIDGLIEKPLVLSCSQRYPAEVLSIYADCDLTSLQNQRSNRHLTYS